MDRDTLLYKIEDEEYTRLYGLTREQLEAEYSEWFQGAFDEHIKTLSSEALRDDLVEDFMMYRRDDSTAELMSRYPHLF